MLLSLEGLTKKFEIEVGEILFLNKFFVALDFSAKFKSDSSKNGLDKEDFEKS